MKYIVMLSYGKDSTAMLDILIKENEPIDYIIFTDTLWEFKELHEYRKIYNEYLKSRYGIEVITLKPKTTLEYWIFGTITRGERKGEIRGIPLVTVPCYWRREAKQKPVEEWVKKNLGKEQVTSYIGYTKEEDRSIKNTKQFTFKYPLKEREMTELDCLKYLREHEMENPLYRDFNRLGCRICPSQSERSWYVVWDKYKETWQEMKDVEQKLSQLEKSGKKVVNRFWFTDHRTTEDMEKEFEMETRSMFDFSSEPVRNCFCHIG